MNKTNAMRALEVAGIPYTPYFIPSKGTISPAFTLREKVGLPPDIMFKTLVARGERRGLWSSACLSIWSWISKNAHRRQETNGRAASGQRTAPCNRLPPWRMFSDWDEEKASHLV